MNVFGKYSQYYNLLYKDKDYSGEVEYICSLIHEYAKDTSDILEFGCGTGAHADLLGSRGYKVTGVDLSKDMLLEAEKLKKNNKNLEFKHGDIRSIEIKRKFDTVLSLFHVISYQITLDDVKKVFKNALYHLKPGGIFIFDVWHGPAVLSKKPSIRVKRMSNEDVEIVRVAEPWLDDSNNIVKVNYDIFIRSRTEIVFGRFQEVHEMQYFFEIEMNEILKLLGFDVLKVEEWLTKDPPSVETWGVCYVARYVGD